MPEGIKVAFNSSQDQVNNGLIFNDDYFLFIENGNEYKLGYSKFEDLNFAETSYDDIFNRVASTIKPVFMPSLLMATYQSGILLTFVFTVVVSILFMLLKMGRQTFLTYKEVLNLVIYSSTFPAVMALVIGMFNGALSMIIYNIGTLVVLFFVYRQKIEPYLSGDLAG